MYDPCGAALPEGLDDCLDGAAARDDAAVSGIDGLEDLPPRLCRGWGNRLLMVCLGAVVKLASGVVFCPV